MFGQSFDVESHSSLGFARFDGDYRHFHVTHLRVFFYRYGPHFVVVHDAQFLLAICPQNSDHGELEPFTELAYGRGAVAVFGYTHDEVLCFQLLAIGFVADYHVVVAVLAVLGGEDDFLPVVFHRVSGVGNQFFDAVFQLPVVDVPERDREKQFLSHLRCPFRAIGQGVSLTNGPPKRAYFIASPARRSLSPVP